MIHVILFCFVEHQIIGFVIEFACPPRYWFAVSHHCFIIMLIKTSTNKLFCSRVYIAFATPLFCLLVGEAIGGIIKCLFFAIIIRTSATQSITMLTFVVVLNTFPIIHLLIRMRFHFSCAFLADFQSDSISCSISCSVHFIPCLSSIALANAIKSEPSV